MPNVLQSRWNRPALTYWLDGPDHFVRNIHKLRAYLLLSCNLFGSNNRHGECRSTARLLVCMYSVWSGVTARRVADVIGQKQGIARQATLAQVNAASLAAAKH